MKTIFCFLFLIAFASCTKENEADCNIEGTYTGTSSTFKGGTGNITYILKKDNFALGSVNLGGPIVTYGSYENTCDSVIISAWYSVNTDYYSLKGKLMNNKTVISGKYYNLTATSDSGTFSMTKQ